jgi:hypothetical protein
MVLHIVEFIADSSARDKSGAYDDEPTSYRV